jgi:hypothetical protein
MDDILYFLLLIGWLGYSFYKQSEKRKKLLAQRKAVESEPVNPSAQYPESFKEFQDKPVETEPDFAKSLEEILLGKPENESLEEIPEMEAQSLETIQEPVNRYSDLNKKEIAKQSFWFNEAEVKRTVPELASLEPETVMIEEDASLAGHELHHFNLRSAVIYSEILNRKYS